MHYNIFQYISANVLAFAGYIFAFLWSNVYFFALPAELEKCGPDDFPVLSIIYMYAIFYGALILLAILIIVYLLEKKFRKFHYNEKPINTAKKVYALFFCLGIFLYISTFIFALYELFISLIDYV